jgi:hypothetical protein
MCPSLDLQIFLILDLLQLRPRHHLPAPFLCRLHHGRRIKLSPYRLFAILSPIGDITAIE